MDVELPSKVDFILFEVSEEAKRNRHLPPQEEGVLALIKEKHLKGSEWQRVLFI